MPKHCHTWKFAEYRAAWGTTGISGRGQTLPHYRECRACGHSERRKFVDGKSKWVTTFCANTPDAVYAWLCEHQRNGYRVHLTHPCRPSIELPALDDLPATPKNRRAGLRQARTGDTCPG